MCYRLEAWGPIHCKCVICDGLGWVATEPDGERPCVCNPNQLDLPPASAVVAGRKVETALVKGDLL